MKGSMDELFMMKSIKGRYPAVLGDHVKKKKSELKGEEIKGAGEGKREKKTRFISI